jgi:hypothetical protein
MNSVQATRNGADAWLVAIVASAALLIGVLCLLLAVDGTARPPAAARSATAARFAAVLWAAACCAVGGFVGFIFGIPRTLSSDTARTEVAASTPTRNKAAPAEAVDPPPRSAASTAVNTNLEQISDWLTKIIVGVSLVNSERIGWAMYDTAETMAASIASGEGGTSLALAVMVYFGVVGLLGGYLLTRLFLQPAFNAADAMRQPDDATMP